MSRPREAVPRREYLPHTADLRVRLEAADLAGLFHEGAAVVRELVAGRSAVNAGESRSIALQAGDPAELFYRYLRELLYLFATERFVPATVHCTELSPTRIAATVRGETFDRDRHETQPEVKAVTRHGLVVERRESSWIAEVIFDV